MRTYISVHYSFAVAEAESFEELFDVVSDVVTLEARVKRAEIDVLHVLEDQGWRAGLQGGEIHFHMSICPRASRNRGIGCYYTYQRILDGIQKKRDIWPAC